MVHPPWSLPFTDTAPLPLLTMVGGDAELLPAGGGPVRLRQGDVAPATRWSAGP
ncbi:cupin domain-containing protein [Streptomyces solincola]|uniref:cupin domain-containing protein n=1 Tax=Streptomyces solincola TaxID=2100817 RepID=UPI00215983DD|nr:cupin domain-containing protein [Streptomyces solincola]